MIGDGGHGKVVRELIALTPDARLEAVLDDRYAAQAGEAPHIGPDGELRGPVAAWRGLLERTRSSRSSPRSATTVCGTRSSACWKPAAPASRV
jgi:hypothetical protein